MNVEDLKHPVIVDVPYFDPAVCLPFLRRTGPLLYLGGEGRYHVAAISFEPVAQEVFDAYQFARTPPDGDAPFFQSGFMGLLPYKGDAGKQKPRIYAVKAALISLFKRVSRNWS